jgi:hypothetical protein
VVPLLLTRPVWVTDTASTLWKTCCSRLCRSVGLSLSTPALRCFPTALNVRPLPPPPPPVPPCLAGWNVQTFAPLNRAVVTALDGLVVSTSLHQQPYMLSLAHAVFDHMWAVVEFGVDVALRCPPSHRLRPSVHCLLVHCLTVLRDAMDVSLSVTAIVLAFPVMGAAGSAHPSDDFSVPSVSSSPREPRGGGASGVAALLRIVGLRLPLSAFAYDPMEAVQASVTGLVASLVRDCRLAAAREDSAGPADMPAAPTAILVS